MSKRKKTSHIILASLGSLLLLTFSATGLAKEKKEMEKCSGIVKEGKADGHSIIDGKKVEWIYVPAGACAKLVDGKVIIDKKD